MDPIMLECAVYRFSRQFRHTTRLKQGQHAHRRAEARAAREEAIVPGAVLVADLEQRLAELLIGLRFSGVAGKWCRAYTASASEQKLPPHFGE